MGSASSSAVPKMKGQSITEDLLNQDENVFVSKNSKNKGLQQYFTPLKVAGFIRRVVSIHSGVVVDLTAGVGNLLTPFEEDDDIFRLGVELDKSNIPKATSNLHIVNANVAELYPYLLQVEFQPNAIVLNPPFSLFWSCPAITGSEDKKIESQLATVLMAVNMVASSGHGAFLVEKSTWDNSIKLNETVKARVYAVVTAQNVFLPYSAVEAVICFFTGSSRNVPSKPFHASFDLNTPNIDKKLNDIAGEIFGFRKVNYMYLDTFSSKDLKDENVKRFLAAHAEYHARKKAKQQLYNIDYVGGRLKVYLSNYTQFIIDRDYSFSERELVEKMRGVSPSYFAFNTQDKRSLYAMLEEKKVITMSPKAHEAIERAIVEADFILTPMYALKPQQRLGYLEDIGQIKCTKSFIRKTQDSEDEPVLKALRRRDGILRKTSDPSANMFEAGKMYDVSVSTTTVQSFYEKVRGAEGKLTEMIKIGKALSIDIGGCLFSETPEDINLIISHFEIPDPKDVRTKKPRLYDRLRARLESPEFRKFTFKAFQVEDLTRLAMKDAMVLSWEQGLGKCTRGDARIEINGKYRRIDSLDYSDGEFDGQGYWSKPKELLMVDSFDERTGKMVRKPVMGLYREWIDTVIEEIELNDGSILPKTLPHRLYDGIDWKDKINVGDFVTVPAKTSPGEFVRDEHTLELLAYLIGEGYDRPENCTWTITQKNVELLNRLMSHGLPCNNQRIDSNDGRRCVNLVLQGRDFQMFVRSLGVEPGKRSKDKRLPHYVMSAKNANVFLRHYFDAEGCATNDSIQLSSASHELVEQLRLLLRRYGIWAFVKKKRKCATNGKRIMRDYWEIVISGDEVVPFARHIGFNDQVKQEMLMRLVSKPHNTNVNVLPTLNILKKCPIGKRRSGINGNRYRTANASREMTLEFIEKLRPFGEARETIEKLEKLVRQDVRYAQVKAVRRIRYTGWVYDLEIDDTHTFVANGIVCHNTRGSLAWAKLKGARKVLIICPQDLKHQWIAQAATFDIALTEIAGYGDIEKIKNAESGYYIVHYELLKGGRRLDTYVSEYLLNTTDEEGDEHTFNALCPKCKGMREDGWNGRSCKKCGYHVWTRRVKALYTYMKKMFDTVIVDEGVKIKSKHSLQGISVRSLHAKNRLLLSGSPIKGWITDAFWLLHWTLGNASPRFPYHYIGGTEKFLEDFGVFEYVAEEFRKSLSKGKKKLLPEIGNLHLLWKMFAPSIIRRVKTETGEDLAKKTVHRIKVNFTVKQKETYDWWIANFNDWFKASHNTDMEEDNIAMKQMILGLLWKLRFSATVPASPLLPGKPAPGKEETFYPGARSNSNYTEKALFVIGKVKECIAAGEQVVIFSALQDEMNFLKALLERHHFRAEVANATVNPKKRGLLMNDFKARKFDVLVAGIQSVNFGHDLVNASTVIMTDYEWDHSTTRQAIDRVHRLTSTREVNVYMLYTDNAIDWKQLFEVIDRKGQSSDLALDGKLMDQEEAQVDFFKIARELLQSHKMGTGGLLSEEDIEHKISELFMHNLAQSVGVDEGEVAPRPLRLSIGSKPRRGVYVNQIELSL